jgi:TatD DNase family protein
VIPYLDINYLILETDCPYLAPAPHRGKRNEPAYTHLVAKRISELTELTIEQVDTITSRTARSLFRL